MDDDLEAFALELFLNENKNRDVTANDWYCATNELKDGYRRYAAELRADGKYGMGAAVEEGFMIDPQQGDVGRRVVYTGNRYPGALPEVGIITSFNSYCVFVRYGDDKHSKGSRRQDLEWADFGLTYAQTGGEN